MKLLTQPAQIIGLIAAIMMIIAIQVKDKKSLFLIFNILGKSLFGINYAMLGEFAGTVTEITYRSTRIRATNNSIIAVPNSVIVTEYVKNWSRLENRRLDIELRIDLNT